MSSKLPRWRPVRQPLAFVLVFVKPAEPLPRPATDREVTKPRGKFRNTRYRQILMPWADGYDEPATTLTAASHCHSDEKKQHS